LQIPSLHTYSYIWKSWGLLRSGGSFGCWSSFYVDSAISGRLSLLFGIGAKTRINSQDREALEEAPSLQTSCTCLSFFFLHRVSVEFRVTCWARFVLRIEILFGAFIWSNRRSRTFYSVSARRTKHALHFLLFVFSYAIYIFSNRNTDAICWDFSKKSALFCLTDRWEIKKINIFY